MDNFLSLLSSHTLDSLTKVAVYLENKTIKALLTLITKPSQKIQENKELNDKLEFYKKKYKAEVQKIGAEIEEKLKINKKIRIYLDGVFDIIHSGHFNAIRQAKQLGDILLCGVNSDEDVLKNKGPTLMNVHERAELARACKWCDEAAEGTPFSPTCETLDKYNCDYCSHGDDITFNSEGVSCLDNIIKANRLKVFKRTEGVSTTEIVGRLILGLEARIEKLDKTDPKNEEIIKDFNEYKEYKRQAKPVVSSFFATSHRINLFSDNKVPKENDRIIYIAGDFDILHIGHIKALKEAKKFGDFLYVGVFDDKIAHQIHGKIFPVLNMEERVFNLLSLRNVDEVVMGAPLKITEDMIKLLKIAVVVRFVTKKEGGVEEEEEGIKRIEDDIYEIPKKLGILKEVELNYSLTNDELMERLWKNKEAYITAYLKKAKKEIKSFKPENKEVNEI